MATRLPREATLAGDLAVHAGRIAVAGALVFTGLVFALGVDVLPMAIGLGLLGAGFIVHGQHRRRRPAAYVEVDADGIRLMPEGTTHAHAAVGTPTVRTFSTQRADASGIAIKVDWAAVRSTELSLRLFKATTEADCEAWLARFDAARAGEPGPPLTSADIALETPSSTARGGAIAVTLAAVVGAVVGYLTAEPIWATGTGAGVLVMASVVAWVAIERRGVGRGLGVLGALALLARPFVHPVVIPVIGGFEVPGPFDEPHLGFFVGGLLALATALGGTRAPRPPL